MFKNEYLFSIFSKITIMITGLFTTMAMSRYLGPVLKGELSYITNIVGVLSVVLSLGIEQSYGYFVRKKGKNILEKYIKTIILLNLAYIIIFIIINLIIYDRTILYISILTILYIISSQLSYVIMIEDINKRNKIILVSNIFYCISTIILYLINNKNIFYPIIVLIFKLLLEIIFYVKFVKNEISLEYNLDKKYLKKVFKIGIPAMFMSLMITFNYSIDVIILKQYEDFRQIGLYTSGVAIANLAWIFSDSFKDVLFSKTAKNNGVKDIVLAIKINLILAILMIIGFILFGKIVIVIINGIQFIDSFSVTLIILIGTIPMIFFKLINTIYINSGKQRRSLIILTISVIINIMMNFQLIPQLGINGAAFSSVLSYSVCGIIFSISFCKEFNIKYREYFIFNKDELKKMKIIK